MILTCVLVIFFELGLRSFTLGLGVRERFKGIGARIHAHHKNLSKVMLALKVFGRVEGAPVAVSVGEDDRRWPSDICFCCFMLYFSPRVWQDLSGSCSHVLVNFVLLQSLVGELARADWLGFDFCHVVT